MFNQILGRTIGTKFIPTYAYPSGYQEESLSKIVFQHGKIWIDSNVF